MTETQKTEKKIYRAGVIIIGNEILSGRTRDTNAQWIAEHLTARGIRLTEVRIIPDIAEMIIETVKTLSNAYDYVFTTGGIGPTHDDITAQCVADAFGVVLEKNDKAFALLEEHYGIEELTPARAKMALIPKGAELIPNPVSAAPGFNIENVYVMAGVPRIMQSMFDFVLESLIGGEPMLSSTVTCNLQESKVAIALGELQEKYPDVDLGSYPHYRGGILGLSLVARTVNADILENITDELITLIRTLGGEPRAISTKMRDD